MTRALAIRFIRPDRMRSQFDPATLPQLKLFFRGFLVSGLFSERVLGPNVFLQMCNKILGGWFGHNAMTECLGGG